jgi:tetratricopeptide (TPR) repeat protein
MFPRSLLLLLLLLPLTTWAAQLPGIRLYQRGEYAKASRTLKEEINSPRRTDKQKALARVYLAASLMALEKEDEAYEQLEELARIYPEQRVDPALFPPELVELELKVRAQLDAERRRQEAEQAELNRIAAAEEAERRRKEQEEAARNQVGPGNEVQGTAPTAPASSFRLRPELIGYSDAAAVFGGKFSVGPALGLTVGGGPVEATVRTLIGRERWAWELEAGYLFGTGALQPRLSVRTTLFPRVGDRPADDPNGNRARWGFGGAVGARWAISRQLSLLADVGGELIPGVSTKYNGGVVVISAGVGYNLF